MIPGELLSAGLLCLFAIVVLSAIVRESVRRDGWNCLSLIALLLSCINIGLATLLAWTAFS